MSDRKPIACQQCGTPFTPRSVRTKYCSRPCQSRAFHERRVLDGRKAQQRQRHAAKALGYTQAWRERNRESIKDQQREYDRNRRRSAGMVPRRVRSAALSLAKAAAGTSGGATVLVQGACAKCGEKFTRRCPLGSETKFCSSRCKGWKAKDRSRRRQLERDAFVSTVDRRTIFDRDGWVCQLCMEPVDPARKWPDLMSASLDHIVPLAKGGTHEPDNCQLAHFLCNSRKSDHVAA